MNERGITQNPPPLHRRTGPRTPRRSPSLVLVGAETIRDTLECRRKTASCSPRYMLPAVFSIKKVF